MNSYLFHVLVTCDDTEDDTDDYVEILADNKLQARKKFKEQTVERYAAVIDWCLIAAYREI